MSRGFESGRFGVHDRGGYPHVPVCLAHSPPGLSFAGLAGIHHHVDYRQHGFQYARVHLSHELQGAEQIARR